MTNTSVSRVKSRLQALLPELEFGRGTHVQWRDCDQVHRDRNPSIGDVAFHDQCVKEYDERIAAIKDAIDLLEEIPGLEGTKHPDNVAVDLFAEAMKAKLEFARNKRGLSGWDDKSDCTAEHLSELLRGHVEKGDPVDVANFACFLWNRQERIATPAEKMEAA